MAGTAGHGGGNKDSDSSSVSGTYGDRPGKVPAAPAAAPSIPPASTATATEPDPHMVRPAKKRTVRRRADPYSIVAKIKLWPSATGMLHGVRSVRLKGGLIEVHTHCGQTARVRNSRSGRLARRLRNKQFDSLCPRCRIPAWKTDKFEETSFV